MSRSAQRVLLLLAFAVNAVAQPAADLKQRAESGNAEAQEALGWRYALGDEGIARDRDLARQWLQKAADQGNAQAIAELGMVYFSQSNSGKPFAVDAPDADVDSYRSTAEALLRRSAKMGDRWGEFWLADILMCKGGSDHDEEAVSWYRKAADDGVLRAQYALARAYAEGRGTKRDRHEAFRWYRAIADRSSNGEAAFRVGFAYEHGLGVAADPAEAKRWYRVASEHRDTDPDADSRRPYDEISSLTLIKTTVSADQRSAVVRSVDGKLRTITVGDTLGTHRGKVERIDGEGIELIEVLPTGYGGWVEKILRMRVE